MDIVLKELRAPSDALRPPLGVLVSGGTGDCWGTALLWASSMGSPLLLGVLLTSVGCSGMIGWVGGLEVCLRWCQFPL